MQQVFKITWSKVEKKMEKQKRNEMGCAYGLCSMSNITLKDDDFVHRQSLAMHCTNHLIFSLPHCALSVPIMCVIAPVIIICVAISHRWLLNCLMSTMT